MLKCKSCGVEMIPMILPGSEFCPNDCDRKQIHAPIVSSVKEVTGGWVVAVMRVSIVKNCIRQENNFICAHTLPEIIDWLKNKGVVSSRRFFLIGDITPRLDNYAGNIMMLPKGLDLTQYKEILP